MDGIDAAPAGGGDWLVDEAIAYWCDAQSGAVRDWLVGVVGVPDRIEGGRPVPAFVPGGLWRLVVGVARVEFDPAGHGLARSWAPVDAPSGTRHGAAAITVPVWQSGIIVDLLALHPERPELWACRTGDLPDMLGIEMQDLRQVGPVADGAPLRVCRSPLAWLRHLLRGHLAWQAEVRRVWPQVVRDAVAGRPGGADPWPGGWRGLRRARGWLAVDGWRQHPAVPREPGPWDAVCLLRPELAEQAFAGLGVELVCDDPGHAAELRDAMAGQRRKRRAAEPGLPACRAERDVLRGAA